MNPNSPADPVAQLCPNCGLCCNGVLFADVKLQKGDDFHRLSVLGLAVNRKGSQRSFHQPCACFDGTWCRIYGERPRYCRAFECGLLKRVRAGTVGVKSALKTIAEARRRADQVRTFLRQPGENDERLALIQRYVQAMREPVDLARDPRASDRRGRLMQAMDDLMQLLQCEFLK